MSKQTAVKHAKENYSYQLITIFRIKTVIFWSLLVDSKTNIYNVVNVVVQYAITLNTPLQFVETLLHSTKIISRIRMTRS